MIRILVVWSQPPLQLPIRRATDAEGPDWLLKPEAHDFYLGIRSQRSFIAGFGMTAVGIRKSRKALAISPQGPQSHKENQDVRWMAVQISGRRLYGILVVLSSPWLSGQARPSRV